MPKFIFMKVTASRRNPMKSFFFICIINIKNSICKGTCEVQEILFKNTEAD